MKSILVKSACLLLTSITLYAAEFTVGSFNCGGLSDHYDYIRASTMYTLMQARHDAEPEQMAKIDKIQQLALKLLFSTNPQEMVLTQRIWELNDYDAFLAYITQQPSKNSLKQSPNTKWFLKSEEMLTPYQVRPIALRDPVIKELLFNHLKGVSVSDPSLKEALEYEQVIQIGRAIMAKKIFQHHLKYDLICIQEATYIDESLLPDHYELLLSDAAHSINGVAWNKQRFEHVETIGDVLGRAFIVILRDKDSQQKIALASAHLTGCDPFHKGRDSSKGDRELKTIIELLETTQADIKIIGMDANVTALHPRLKLLKTTGYAIDYENHLETTCTNPYLLLNTRLDWIAIKSDSASKIVNIPVLGVGLNSIESNMSDHKPIAAQIQI